MTDKLFSELQGGDSFVFPEDPYVSCVKVRNQENKYLVKHNGNVWGIEPNKTVRFVPRGS